MKYNTSSNRLHSGANAPAGPRRKGANMGETPAAATAAARSKTTVTVVGDHPLPVDHEAIDFDGPMVNQATDVVSKVRLRLRVHSVPDKPLPLAG